MVVEPPRTLFHSEQGFARRMAGFVHVAMRLMLLCLITTGVAGEDALISTFGPHDLAFPCEGGFACFHIWPINSEFIAIVSNGEIQTPGSEKDKCTLQIQDITAEDVGRHRCQQRTNDLSLYNTAPVITLTPTKTVSLQCVFLDFVKKRYCHTELYKWVSLMWVDEAGGEIQVDSQHHIVQSSSCDVTLTVTYQSPENMKFRCRATVDGQVFTSVELQVRALAIKGKGRGLIVEPESEYQGHNQDTIGAAVGVVGCVVLTAAVAVFAVNRRRRRRRRRRRSNSQLHNESCSVQSSSCHVINTDDVIYADIIHPDGCDRVWSHECASTEYACVQYK